MKIDFKALKKKRKQNREERLAFLEMYAEWLKRTPNKIWSKQHAEFINAGLRKHLKKGVEIKV